MCFRLFVDFYYKFEFFVFGEKYFDEFNMFKIFRFIRYF